MDPIDALSARFRRLVESGLIRCTDVDSIVSGWGSGDAIVSVPMICQLVADADLQDDAFWELAEAALEQIGEDRSWIHQMHSRASPLSVAGGWGRAWLAPSGVVMLRVQGPHGQPLPLGRRDVAALADHIEQLARRQERDAGPEPPNGRSWSMGLERGFLRLRAPETRLGPGEALELVAELRVALPSVCEQTSVDPESLPKPPEEPATVERARAEWRDGKRILAMRIYREATGASLAEAKAALEGR
jgi:hypothetical protein